MHILRYIFSFIYKCTILACFSHKIYFFQDFKATVEENGEHSNCGGDGNGIVAERRRSFLLTKNSQNFEKTYHVGIRRTAMTYIYTHTADGGGEVISRFPLCTPYHTIPYYICTHNKYMCAYSVTNAKASCPYICAKRTLTRRHYII